MNCNFLEVEAVWIDSCLEQGATIKPMEHTGFWVGATLMSSSSEMFEISAYDSVYDWMEANIRYPSRAPVYEVDELEKVFAEI